MRYVDDFISAVKARQAEIGNSLIAGHIVNLETYQRILGQHPGLVEALNKLYNLLKEEDESE